MLTTLRVNFREILGKFLANNNSKPKNFDGKNKFWAVLRDRLSSVPDSPGKFVHAKKFYISSINNTSLGVLFKRLDSSVSLSKSPSSFVSFGNSGTKFFKYSSTFFSEFGIYFPFSSLPNFFHSSVT